MSINLKNIQEYKIVTVSCEPRLFEKENTPLDIEKEIQSLIHKGWQPFGDLKINMSQGGSFLGVTSSLVLTQVMVKYN